MLGRMRSLILAILLMESLLSACSFLPQQPRPFTELAMQHGDSITSETSSGNVTIIANGSLTRTVTWEDASRSVRLFPRPKRWYGSLGAYNRDNEDVREHNGITRILFQEGQQHFETVEQALAWLRRPWYQPRSVYNDDGVFVQFSKTPERSQLNVDVFQIYIRGRKPTKLPGSQNNKIHVTNNSTNAA